MKRLSAEYVKSLALRAGLDAVGIASAEPDLEALKRVREQVERGLKPYWDLNNLDSRFDPCSELAGARSVLVAANCYLESGPETLGKPGQPHGRIARYCWGNYYRDTRERLRYVADLLAKELGKPIRYKILSNNRLAEKPLAVRAGVGWYGKHGVITTSKYGSWIVLGLLVIDQDLEPDEPAADGCRNCRACMDACPTGAIVEPYVVDSRKCLQWLSSRQMILPDDIRMIWGDRLYGCTSCLEICPYNKGVMPKDRTSDHGWIGPSLPLIPILEMTEEEFRKKYRGNQISESWVSFGAIQRNAVVALGNIGDRTAVSVLKEVVRKSSRPVVREHAEWALQMIG